MALAVQGADGLAALLDCLRSDDPTVRHKVVIGVGVLGRGGRSAVLRLIRVLAQEPHSLVISSIIDALGGIGGVEARAALERLTKVRPWDAELIDQALRRAAIEDLLNGE